MSVTDLLSVKRIHESVKMNLMVVIPYIAGRSEDIRRVCSKFNIRVVFILGRTQGTHNLVRISYHLVCTPV